MSDQYVGEIRLWPVTQCPNDWHFCDGSLLPISGYNVLFALLGTTYGGDGVNTFGLPDLRARVPVHNGTGTGLTNRVIGSKSGEVSVALTSASIPTHNHAFNACNLPGSTNTPTAATALATAPTGSNLAYYQTTGHGETIVQLNSLTMSNDGGGLPHENRMPSLAINFIIALNGLYPQQN